MSCQRIEERGVRADKKIPRAALPVIPKAVRLSELSTATSTISSSPGPPLNISHLRTPVLKIGS